MSAMVIGGLILLEEAHQVVPLALPVIQYETIAPIAG
jgi:hypothetical protein